jgi:hypothetical protein
MIGLPLSIKYQQRAYLYYILSSPCKRDSSFEILLEGVNCQFHLDNSDIWVESHQVAGVTFDTELIQLIGKTINSHFHIKKHHF